MEPLSSLDSAALSPRIPKCCSNASQFTCARTTRGDQAGPSCVGPLRGLFEAGPGRETFEQLRGWVSSAGTRQRPSARLLHRLRAWCIRGTPTGRSVAGRAQTARAAADRPLVSSLHSSISASASTLRRTVRRFSSTSHSGQTALSQSRTCASPRSSPANRSTSAGVAPHSPVTRSTSLRISACRTRESSLAPCASRGRWAVGRGHSVGAPSRTGSTAAPGIRRVRDSQAVKIGLRFVQPPEHREVIGAT